jgi:hypothetical protein
MCPSLSSHRIPVSALQSSVTLIIYYRPIDPETGDILMVHQSLVSELRLYFNFDYIDISSIGNFTFWGFCFLGCYQIPNNVRHCSVTSQKIISFIVAAVITSNEIHNYCGLHESLKYVRTPLDTVRLSRTGRSQQNAQWIWSSSLTEASVIMSPQCATLLPSHSAAAATTPLPLAHFPSRESQRPGLQVQPALKRQH